MMAGKGYDEICNHCGKDIHPPRALITDPFFPSAPWLQAAKAADCIWVERYPVRNMPVHPLTNYICTECAAELQTWLHAALGKPQQEVP